MAKPQYLTKSKFTHCLDCPTKLYYAINKEYKSTMDDNDFLQALAKGGIQVGELAKLYYPGGTDIISLDYEESVAETNELLKEKNATIYEAAVRTGDCFIRVDVLEKTGNRLNLIEVKSKSWNPDVSFLKKDGTLASGWQSYLYDVAFQYRVMQKAFPGRRIEPYLMLIDKSRAATVDGLHQNFKVVEENGRFSVKVKDGVTGASLGQQILRPVHVGEYVDLILSGEAREPASEPEARGFDEWLETLSSHLQNNEKYPARISNLCKNCEYRMDPGKLADGEKSGFEECWSETLNWKKADFDDPHIFNIWNYRGTGKLLDQEIYKKEELIPGLLPASPDRLLEASEWDNKQRQTLQIVKATGYHESGEAVLPSLFHQMESWTYPLHFIDFEAVLAAIPFHKGLKPYDYLPFQFSCHTLYEDGRVEHRADWIEERPGYFPCFEFVRRLKQYLENDNGTIFRYHHFENTVLNKVAEQLRAFQPDDADELIEWIQTITKGGEREMVDQYELIKKYYYSPWMEGSISIKKVLPAVLTESRRLREIYSKPYSGLYIRDKIFYQEDPKTGKAVSPYKLLDPVGYGIPGDEEAEEALKNEQDVIADGGAAMMAWSRLQFDDLPEQERQHVLQSLYQYCELDTLAMVMIHQHWEGLRSS